MRKILFASFLAPALLLGGCQSTVTTDQVQQAAVQICGFLPTAQSVGQIIAAAFNSAGAGAILVTAGSIAQSICDAVTAVPPKQLAGKLRANRIIVNGIPVSGRFVR